jgi:hypothetical protein
MGTFLRSEMAAGQGVTLFAHPIEITVHLPDINIPKKREICKWIKLSHTNK